MRATLVDIPLYPLNVVDKMSRKKLKVCFHISNVHSFHKFKFLGFTRDNWSVGKHVQTWLGCLNSILSDVDFNTSEHIFIFLI